MGVKNENGKPLVDSILDATGQGTGKWTVSALDQGALTRARRSLQEPVCHEGGEGNASKVLAPPSLLPTGRSFVKP